MNQINTHIISNFTLLSLFMIHLLNIVNSCNKSAYQIWVINCSMTHFDRSTYDKSPQFMSKLEDKSSLNCKMAISI